MDLEFYTKGLVWNQGKQEIAAVPVIILALLKLQFPGGFLG
jgi:hypothetical protein